MIQYKKALLICFLQYVLMLLLHICYAALLGSNEQLVLTLICSGIIMVALGTFTGLFYKYDFLVTCVTFASVIFSAYFIGVVLHTLAFAILMYLVTLLIVSMYLNPKYILVFGVSSTLAEISFILFFPEILLEMVPSLFLYGCYIVCYGLGVVNVYFLVASARKYLDQAEAKAREAKIANEHKSRFVANISHEIRTPMNVILGMSKILENMELPEEAGKCTKCIADSGEILMSLINDVLDLSKIESGKYEIITGDYYIYNMLDAVKSLISANVRNRPIKFSIVIPNKLPEILCGDENRIRQVLINLLNNAVKFTREGEVRLEAEWKADDENAGVLVFRVIDTGTGIRQENMERLFDSFERFDAERHKEIEGSGLGLSICKSLVLLMNGTISVKSEYGKGSTFLVEIPQKISKKDAPAVKNMKEEEEWKAPKQAKVLVIDDLVTNLAVAKGLMAFWDVVPDCVTGGQEALQKMEQQRYDLIFLDHMMPEMDGEETLRQIHQRGGANFEGVPVVALTANAEMGKEAEFRRLGFSDYLSKPIEPKRLERILQKYLNAGNAGRKH